MRPTILFDLDGTLIDPLAGIAAAYARAAEAVGRAVPSPDDVRAFIGPPIQDVFIQQWDCSPEEVTRAVEAFRRYYGVKGITELAVYDGVDATLTSLYSARVTLGVATSKPLPYALQILESLGWSDLFAVVAGAELSGERRAKADVISHALAQLDVAPDEVTMVGDRREDMHGALSAGVTPIGALWGYGSRGELEEAGAALLLARPEDAGQLFAAH